MSERLWGPGEAGERQGIKCFKDLKGFFPHAQSLTLLRDAETAEETLIFAMIERRTNHGKLSASCEAECTYFCPGKGMKLWGQVLQSNKSSEIFSLENRRLHSIAGIRKRSSAARQIASIVRKNFSGQTNRKQN